LVVVAQQAKRPDMQVSVEMASPSVPAGILLAHSDKQAAGKEKETEQKNRLD